MTKLRRKLWRDLVRMRWRALTIVLTTAIGVGVYVGIYLGVASLFWTRDTTYEQLRFADLEVRFAPEDAYNLPDLSDLRGVERIERRLIFPGTVGVSGDERLSGVVTFLENPLPEIHSFRFLDGRPLQAGEQDAVVIERTLAVFHGYRVGDMLTAKVGEKILTSRIVGIAITPEYLVSTSNPEYFVPEKGSLGVVFANIDQVSDSLGFTLVNDLLFRFQPGWDPTLLKKRILARLEGLTIDQVIPAERHFSYKFIQLELEHIQLLAPAIVIILFTLALIMTSINFNRMVAVQKREIGVLMALGYSRRIILQCYFEISAGLGLLASLLGLGLGVVFRDLVAGTSVDAMGMPLLLTTLDFAIMAKGVGYALGITIVSATLPVLRLLRSAPHSVLRDSRGGKDSYPQFLRLLTSLPIAASYRYGLRNLVRQRGRSAATITAIALALGVTMAYRMNSASIDETLFQRLRHQQWGLVVDFLHPVFLEDVEELRSMAGVEKAEPYLRRYVELQNSGRFADAVLVGAVPNSSMFHLDLIRGREPGSGETREAVLSPKLAEYLHADIGDRIIVHSLHQEHVFDVVGVSSDVATDTCIIPFQVAQDILQTTDKASGVYLQANTSSPGLRERLLEWDFVGTILEKEALFNRIRTLLGAMFSLLHVATIMTIFVSVLFVFTSTNLSILDSDTEFATLRALGYGRRPIAGIIFTESFATAICAVIASIPIAIVVTSFLNYWIGQAWFRVENHFFLSDFAAILVPALLFIPLGAYPGLSRILGVPIDRTMRDRVIE